MFNCSASRKKSNLFRPLAPLAAKAACVTTACFFIQSALLAAPPSADPQRSTAELLKKVNALESKVESLETRLSKYESGGTQSSDATSKLTARVESLETRFSRYDAEDGQNNETAAKLDDNSLFGLGYRSKSTLKIGAYGEVKYGRQQTPDGWQTGFDMARIVLLPTLQISDTITFNAELEFEHGGIAVDDDDKLTGAVEVEQAYLDFKFNDYFNWRAPGVDVVPFGYINLFHEPTQFYSVNRPELYRGLIPSTWFGGGTSIYGRIVENLNYQFQINTGLEDVGSKEGVPSDKSPYEAGITGTEALGLARTTIGDFKQAKSAPGYALRLSYTPPFVTGLNGSTSVFFTPNVTPRGAFSDAGNALGNSSVTMFDTELRYRLPKTGFEFRGEFVNVFLGSPGNLRANNDSDFANNVGKSMWGFSLEAAYHWELAPRFKNGWEIVPFYRYTYENLQTGGFSGSDADAPTGQGKRQFHTFGLAVFPTPQVVLKLDCQIALDDAPNSPKADHILGSVGFFF